MGHLFAQADAARLPLQDQSIDLCFGSPPYADARLYLENGVDLGISRDAREWVEWMLLVTAEALRVTRGPVLWVCAGVTRDRNYWPACEGLLWEGWKRGWLCECPCYWHRSGISGSGGDQWFRKDVEYILCFKASAEFPWSDNTAMGSPPKWMPGGEPSHRMPNGRRVAKLATAASSDGRRVKQGYNPPGIANPGNFIAIDEWPSSVVEAKVGGGNLGSDYAHANEAPFPEALAEHFIRSFCPPGGTVLDCFSGSGTTVSVAERLGRVGIGFDLRKSQCDLGARRLTRPHAPVVKSQRPEQLMPLFD